MVRGSICFQTLRAKIPNHALTRAPRSNAGSRPRGRPRSNPTLSRPRMALRAAVQHRVHRFFHRGGELCALVVVQRDGFGAKRRRERLESVRRDAKQRHLGGRRPGTHRPRDGRRLRGYPRGRSRPHPRRGRVPVPAERGGERRGGSRPRPRPRRRPRDRPRGGSAVRAPSRPRGVDCAVRLRLRLAHLRALFESPGKVPGARLEPDSSRSFSMTLIQYASTSSVVLCVSDPSA